MQYPTLTHLCLPGNLFEAWSAAPRGRIHAQPHTALYPKRHTLSTALGRWESFGNTFPALTHLYLPGLLLCGATRINLAENTLVKLSIGPGGPPVPLSTITELVISHAAALKAIHLGNLSVPQNDWDDVRPFIALGQALCRCEHIEDFRFEYDETAAEPNRITGRGMTTMSHWIYSDALKGPWRRSLRVS